jgi:hypothetical protein
VGIRDRQVLCGVGPLAWSLVSRSPYAPSSFPADQDQLALGRALAARVSEVARLAAEAAAATGLLELGSCRFAKPIHDVHMLASRVIARFLITGQGTTMRERNFIAGFGVIAALYRLPVATLAASFLLWRDANLRVLNEEVKRLGTAWAVSEEARKIIRSIADTGMVGMAVAYDDQVLAKKRK